MKRKTVLLKSLKIGVSLLMLCVILFAAFPAAQTADSADEAPAVQYTAVRWNEKLCAPQGGVLAVAHRGETTAHTPNTLDAILAAAEAGAELISVELTKTADNAFVLLTEAQKQAVSAAQTLEQMQAALFGALSAQQILTLQRAADALNARAGLILDFDWNDRAALVGYLRENALTDAVLLRVPKSAKTALRFYEETGGDVRVLGVYRGNVVMNAISYLSRFSDAGLPTVQYQNKNYFCVSFQRFTTKRFSAGGNCRALVNMTEKNLCAQREDSVTDWDDLISHNFSVIETGNIESLAAYLAEREKSGERLSALLERANALELSRFAEAGGKAMKTAIENGIAALNANASLSARQAAISALQSAQAALVPRGENETLKGTLQITGGKVLTVLVFAALVLAVQVYIYRKKERKEGEESYAEKSES